MYQPTGHEVIVPIGDCPTQEVGATQPVIFCDEHTLILAYRIKQERSAEGDVIALLRFTHLKEHRFGQPNDEAFSGHPLASAGLEPYGAFEVKSSPWIHELERMNAVHPAHKPEHFKVYRHFIFTFHDGTFECVAQDLEVLPMKSIKGPMREIFPQILDALLA